MVRVATGRQVRVHSIGGIGLTLPLTLIGDWRKWRMRKKARRGSDCSTEPLLKSGEREDGLVRQAERSRKQKGKRKTQPWFEPQEDEFDDLFWCMATAGALRLRRV